MITVYEYSASEEIWGLTKFLVFFTLGYFFALYFLIGKSIKNSTSPTLIQGGVSIVFTLIWLLVFSGLIFSAIPKSQELGECVEKGTACYVCQPIDHYELEYDSTRYIPKIKFLDRTFTIPETSYTDLLDRDNAQFESHDWEIVNTKSLQVCLTREDLVRISIIQDQQFNRDQ